MAKRRSPSFIDLLSTGANVFAKSALHAGKTLIESVQHVQSFLPRVTTKVARDLINFARREIMAGERQSALPLSGKLLLEDIPINPYIPKQQGEKFRYIYSVTVHGRDAMGGIKGYANVVIKSNKLLSNKELENIAIPKVMQPDGFLYLNGKLIKQDKFNVFSATVDSVVRSH